MTVHAAMLRQPARRRPLVYLIALAFALGALVMAYEAYVAHKETLPITRNNDQLRVRQAAALQEPSQSERDLQRQWTSLRQERAFPWASVFRSVEHVADSDIELLEFRPDRRAGTLVLKGEGRTAESVMRYLQRLQEDATFSRVYLAHTASMERGQLVTRTFELRLSLAAKAVSAR